MFKLWRPLRLSLLTWRFRGAAYTGHHHDCCHVVSTTRTAPKERNHSQRDRPHSERLPLVAGGIPSGSVCDLEDHFLGPWNVHSALVVCSVLLPVSNIPLMRAISHVLIRFERPNNPLEARWLSGKQKMMIIQRRASDNTGVESKVFKREQIGEALLDAKTWLIWLAIIALQVSHHQFPPVLLSHLQLQGAKWRAHHIQHSHHLRPWFWTARDVPPRHAAGVYEYGVWNTAVFLCIAHTQVSYPDDRRRHLAAASRCNPVLLAATYQPRRPACGPVVRFPPVIRQVLCN